MNLPASSVSSFPSCTKSVTIRVLGDVIKLKQNGEVMLNGDDVNTMPLWIDGIYIRHASSVFIAGTTASKITISNAN